MGYVSEMLDTWDWQQLRDEVDRLSRGYARMSNQAEGDRDMRLRLARQVCRGIDVDYARAFARPGKAISGGTLSVRLDTDTVRLLLQAIEGGE